MGVAAHPRRLRPRGLLLEHPAGGRPHRHRAPRDPTARPAALGQQLLATGRLDDTRNGVGLSSCEVTDREGRPVARCVGRNVVLTDDLAGRYGRWPRRGRPGPPRGGCSCPTAARTPPATARRYRPPRPHGRELGGRGPGRGARRARRAGPLARPRRRARRLLGELHPPRAHPGQPVMCRVVVEHAGRRLRVGRGAGGRARAAHALATGTAFLPRCARAREQYSAL